MLDLVERTWAELGYRVQAVGYKVWVRTRPHPRRVGLIWLPPKQASFYGELPHLRTITAVVLSAGPRGDAAVLKPGDLVAFKRLHFARMAQLEPTQTDEYGGDEEYVGYVNARDIIGTTEEISVRVIPTDRDIAERVLGARG